MFDEHKGHYGSPRITAELREQDKPCGENRVAARIDAGLSRQGGTQIQSDHPIQSPRAGHPSLTGAVFRDRGAESKEGQRYRLCVDR